jgi:hypothetical protein
MMVTRVVDHHPIKEMPGSLSGIISETYDFSTYVDGRMFSSNRGGHMQSVALKRAIIAARINTAGKVIAVKAFDKSDRAITRANTQWDLTWGACESRWDDHPQQRMEMLSDILSHLIQGHDADPQTVRAAAMAVAEYRDLHLSEA